jgi:hypothetical protein
MKENQKCRSRSTHEGSAVCVQKFGRELLKEETTWKNQVRKELGIKTNRKKESQVGGDRIHVAQWRILVINL